MDIKLATLSALSALFFLPQLATAGGLAKTGRAIGNKTSGSSSSGGGRSSGGGSSSTPTPPSSNASHDHRSSTRSTSHARGNYRSSGYLVSGRTQCDGCGIRRSPLRLPAPDIDLSLAAQNVRDSDGSLRFKASLLFGRLGVLASGDYYFEEISDAGDPKTMMEARSESVRMNLFELALLGRVIDTPDFKADIHAGVGVASSSLFVTLPGTTVGVSLQARASNAVTLRAEGRRMDLSYDIRALEGAAGVQWRELWLGYRALQFNVGEVLQGPEVGLRFRF